MSNAKNKLQIRVTAIEGVAELQSLLNQLPDAVVKRTMKSAMLAAGNAVKNAAKGMVPVRTGALKRSIIAGVREPRRGNSIYAIVGLDAKAIYHKGTGKRIKKKDPTPAKYDRPSKTAHFTELGTSRQPAQPWLRPAAISQKSNVHKIMAQGASKGLEKEVRRLRKKAARKGIVLT